MDFHPFVEPDHPRLSACLPAPPKKMDSVRPLNYYIQSAKLFGQQVVRPWMVGGQKRFPLTFPSQESRYFYKQYDNFSLDTDADGPTNCFSIYKVSLATVCMKLLLCLWLVLSSLSLSLSLFLPELKQRQKSLRLRRRRLILRG